MGTAQAPQAPQRTAAQLAASIAQLTSELDGLRRQKKEWNREMNARIRDLEECISLETEEWIALGGCV